MSNFPGKYIYYPVFVFLIFFAVDKVMLIPEMKRLSQEDATYLYFDYKQELMDDMGAFIKNAPDKKIIAVLGSSRLLYFDYPRFSRNFPDWEIYNFSAPVTAPAYYYYILESLIARGIKPAYILMEADPFQYNENSNAFLKSNLSYSFSMPFILRNADLFTNQEISYYLGRWLFASYRYPPSFKRIAARIKNPNDRFLVAYNKVDEYQKKNHGAGPSIIPREDWYERDFTTLEISSRKIVQWLYGNYRFSERQKDFLLRTIDLAGKNNIAILLVRPPVSRPMQAILDEDPHLSAGLKIWDREILKMSDSYGIPYLDLTNHSRFYCNTFVDGAHMSLDCYHPFMQEVMRSLLEMEEKK